jgi:hypothetical protein
MPLMDVCVNAWVFEYAFASLDDAVQWTPHQWHGVHGTEV